MALKFQKKTRCYASQKTKRFNFQAARSHPQLWEPSPPGYVGIYSELPPIMDAVSTYWDCRHLWELLVPVGFIST